MAASDSVPLALVCQPVPSLSVPAALGQPRGPPGARKGQDVEVVLDLDFMEAAFGCHKEVQINLEEKCSPCAGSGAEAGSSAETCGTCGGAGQVRASQGMFQYVQDCPQCHGVGETIKDKCKSCHGAGTTRERKKQDFNVPAGVDTGEHLKVNSGGNAGSKGGPSGHLFVAFRVARDPVFTREGSDVFVSVPISISEAVLGGTVVVPTLSGDVEMKVPAGTQSGESRRLRGRGIAKLRGGGSGDQYIQFKVVIPSPEDMVRERDEHSHRRASLSLMRADPHVAAYCADPCCCPPCMWSQDDDVLDLMRDYGEARNETDTKGRVESFAKASDRIKQGSSS